MFIPIDDGMLSFSSPSPLVLLFFDENIVTQLPYRIIIEFTIFKFEEC